MKESSRLYLWRSRRAVLQAAAARKKDPICVLLAAETSIISTGTEAAFDREIGWNKAEQAKESYGIEKNTNCSFWYI